MNTKHFIFLTAALTAFTAQCMNENDNNQIVTIENIRKQRDILLQKNSCKHSHPKILFNNNPEYCEPFSICLNPTTEHDLNITQYNIYNNKFEQQRIWPIWQPERYFQLTSILKNTNVNGCSILGAAVIAAYKNQKEQSDYIKLLLHDGCRPTNTDKQLAILNQYERCVQYIPNILYFYYFMHVNNIPQDLIHYIALLTFNLEEPLF